MATQHFKRNFLLNLYREEKISLVCFLLPLKRDKNVWHLQPLSSILETTGLPACYPLTLIRWKYTFRWVDARSGKKPVTSRKLKNLTKTVVMKIKMNQCAFLIGLRLQLSSFPRWKMLLLLQGPKSHAHKVCLLAVSELCKDTPRTHGTILWEKLSAESVA